MAQELAALTGESMTTAVTEAVRERLARIKRGTTRERISRIQAQVAKQLKGESLPDHAELLYDERGLPK